MHLVRDGPTVFFFPTNEGEIRILIQLATTAQTGDKLTLEGSDQESRNELFRVAFFRYRPGPIQLILQGDGPVDKEIIRQLTNACLTAGEVMYLGPRLGDELALQFQWPEAGSGRPELLKLISPSRN